MGVETVWIIDPMTRSGRMCPSAEWVATHRLAIAGSPIQVDLDDLFTQIVGPATSQTT